MDASRLSWWRRPEALLPLTFLAAILAGTVLLLLPGMSRGDAVGTLEAFFTATSAVCVTGLVVVDTGADFTRAGQTVILLLIQLGGLGIMTFSVLVLVLVGRRVSLNSETRIRETFTPVARWSLGRLLGAVFAATVIVEAVGYVALSQTLEPFSAAFHSVSGFCNAGFSLSAESLADEGSGVVVPILVLFVLGGLGFTVLLELVLLALRRRRRLTLHARLALSTTLLLLGLGTILLVITEHGEPDKAFFFSATARTAGFETAPAGELRAASLLVLIFLMFVGASPGSTGGGIKTTTLATAVLLAVAILRGRDQVVVHGREIPVVHVRRGFAVLSSALLVVFVSIFLLQVFEEAGGYRFVQLAFEAVSAFGTVGLSTGITPHLEPASKLLLCAVMFVGRVGTLSFFMLLVQAGKPSRVRYPEEPVLIG